MENSGGLFSFDLNLNKPSSSLKSIQPSCGNQYEELRNSYNNTSLLESSRKTRHKFSVTFVVKKFNITARLSLPLQHVCLCFGGITLNVGVMGMQRANASLGH